MYIPNAVRRSVIRALNITKELKSILPEEPKKIFIEMSRDDYKEKLKNKGKNTKSRREQIENILEVAKEFVDNTEELKNKLGKIDDSNLRSEKYFLYFTQLGKCMYSKENIVFEKIGSDKTYDIDHIYPQSKTKDDSLDNKVLVLSELNGQKGDTYPIKKEIRDKMIGFWKTLLEKNLISEKKYSRLIRCTKFSDEELSGFINRQLVETRQSTKAVAEIIKDIFPNSEVVYVKAGLVSEFRNEFDMIKCREINDLHHAKDAYLNIVVGNAYNVKFTKNPMNIIKNNEERYSMNTKTMFGDKCKKIERNNVCAWEPEVTMKQVKATMKNNNIRIVRYSYCQKGQLFDINIVKKGKGSIPVKKGIRSNTEKYGGYNKAKSAYFYLIKHEKKNKIMNSFVPIDLMFDSQLKTEEDIIKFCKEKLNLCEPKLLLNGRKIKFKSLLEIDGFRYYLSSKNGTNSLKLKCAEQLILESKWEIYSKRIFKFEERNKNNKNIKITQWDKMTKKENIELYEICINKLEATKYMNLTNNPIITLKESLNYFKDLPVEEQVLALANIIKIFGGADTVNLKIINGVENARMLTMSRDLSKNIHIIDQSPTGLFEKKSPDLSKI